MTKRIVINEKGDTIPINLLEFEEEDELLYSMDIDGVEWVVTENKVHAVVMFEMMTEHITEYMHYELTN